MKQAIENLSASVTSINPSNKDTMQIAIVLYSNLKHALSIPVMLWRKTIGKVRDRLGLSSSSGVKQAPLAALELKVPPLILVGFCAALLWSAAMSLPELSI